MWVISYIERFLEPLLSILYTYGYYMNHMNIIGHVAAAAAPGPLACPASALGPLAHPSCSARPRNELNVS